MLSISGGAAVDALNVSVNSSSLLAIERRARKFAGGWQQPRRDLNQQRHRPTVGGGELHRATRTPQFQRGTWSGSGTYQAVGGTWNATSHRFSVSATQAGTAGTPVAIDLSQVQRVLVTDTASGASIGASFLAATSPTPITFTASPAASPMSAALADRFASPSSVLSDWTCAATGYASGNPAYLSLDIGAGYSSDDLDVWSYSRGSWLPFSAYDLTYDGTYASFTVTGFGTFAVTTGMAFLPGDANGDGRVDVNDLTIVLSNFGQTGCVWSQGCMDGDPTGTVDINDLTIVLSNFGTYGASSGIKAVPEPSTIALAIAGGLCLLAFAWRRRRVRQFVSATAVLLILTAGVAQAQVSNVFNMPNGETSLQFVTVGNPGNVADTAVMVADGTTGYGSVPYVYQIGKYDVTIGQYVEFLNAVAKTDTYGLYSSSDMAGNFAPYVGVGRSGSSGSYSYSVTGSDPQAANCPIFSVSWGDAARFCNWLENGQPTFAQERRARWQAPQRPGRTP